MHISFSSSLFFILIIIFSISLSISDKSNSSSSSSSKACKSTPYPKLCRSILSAFKSSPSDPYGAGKFSVKQCLKQAKKLSKLINADLSTKLRRQVKSTPVEISAIEDCDQLFDLNVDYLETISSQLKSANMMSEEVVERVETLLGGIVTNQQTCYDGLVEAKSSFATALSVPMRNVSQLYSVSLGLVSHSLARNMKKRGKGKDDELRRANRVRHPLYAIIKSLRKGHLKDRRWGERVLEELENNGILVNDTVTVGQYSTDNFTTIGDAVEFAPNNTKAEDGYFIIYVREGYYQEYVVIPKYKKNVMMIGDGINQTVITGNHSFVGNWSTYNSSTFAVVGERFAAVDITFKNTAGPQNHQAVAVRSNADLSTFFRCSFEGYQDTLYVHSLRQFYRECDIYGTVDFIFGNAAAVFQNCNLYARKPLPNQKNAITAQGRTDPNQPTGISIQNCTIKATPDLAMDLNSTLTFLGRPWKNYSRTVFMQSYIDDLVHPSGWLEWNGSYGLDTLYYGEFSNYGPGANTSSRVRWPGYSLMNRAEAFNFTVYNFTMGDTWLPDTDIPFFNGL